MSRHTYRCLIRWQHRRWGPQLLKTASEGTSIRRAISAALMAFFSDAAQREFHRDAHAQVSIEAWRVKKQADL